MNLFSKLDVQYWLTWKLIYCCKHIETCEKKCRISVLRVLQVFSSILVTLDWGNCIVKMASLKLKLKVNIVNESIKVSLRDSVGFRCL